MLGGCVLIGILVACIILIASKWELKHVNREIAKLKEKLN